MLTIPKPKICSAGNRVTSCSRIFCFCSQAFLNAKEILSLINRVILEWIQHTQTELLFCVKKKGAERKSHHSKKKTEENAHSLIRTHAKRNSANKARMGESIQNCFIFSQNEKHQWTRCRLSRQARVLKRRSRVCLWEVAIQFWLWPSNRK